MGCSSSSNNNPNIIGTLNQKNKTGNVDKNNNADIKTQNTNNADIKTQNTNNADISEFNNRVNNDIDVMNSNKDNESEWGDSMSKSNYDNQFKKASSLKNNKKNFNQEDSLNDSKSYKKKKSVQWADIEDICDDFKKDEYNDSKINVKAPQKSKTLYKEPQGESKNLNSQYTSGFLSRIINKAIENANGDSFCQVNENSYSPNKSKEDTEFGINDFSMGQNTGFSDFELRNLVDANKIKLPPQIHNSSKGLNYGSNYQITTNTSGCQKQWSISSGTLIEDWEQVHHSKIVQSQHSTYGNRLFTLDEVGDQFEWKIGPPSAFRKDWKEVLGNEIRTFCLTSDGLHLWTADSDAVLLKSNTRERCIEKNFGAIFTDNMDETKVDNSINYLLKSKYVAKVSTMACTKDGSDVFLSDGYGAMKQFSFDKNNKEKMTIKFHEHASLWEIHKMIITESNQYLFTLDSLGCLRQFLIKEKKLYYDWSNYYETEEIGEFILTKDNKYLFTTDKSLAPNFLGNGLGNLKQFRIENRQLVRDFGDITSCIGMIFSQTADGKYLFTCDNEARLKQWNIKQKNQHSDWGNIDEKTITSLMVF